MGLKVTRTVLYGQKLVFVKYRALKTDDGSKQFNLFFDLIVIPSHTISGVYILQMTRILFPGRTDPAPKIFAIEGNPTPPN